LGNHYRHQPFAQNKSGRYQSIGRMDKQGETRTCEMESKGRKGTMTENLLNLFLKRKQFGQLKMIQGMGKCKIHVFCLP